MKKIRNDKDRDKEIKDLWEYVKLLNDSLKAQEKMIKAIVKKLS